MAHETWFETRITAVGKAALIVIHHPIEHKVVEISDRLVARRDHRKLNLALRKAITKKSCVKVPRKLRPECARLSSGLPTFLVQFTKSLEVLVRALGRICYVERERSMLLIGTHCA